MIWVRTRKAEAENIINISRALTTIFLCVSTMLPIKIGTRQRNTKSISVAIPFKLLLLVILLVVAGRLVVNSSTILSF